MLAFRRTREQFSNRSRMPEYEVGWQTFIWRSERVPDTEP